MTDAMTIDFNEPVPVFPLPNCVLLPNATLPLHIFETRYRKMIADALGSRRLIAMALFEGEHWRQDYEGSPTLRPFVCVGLINHHVKLPDGRYNIRLQGICRAKIHEEIDGDRPYRRVRLKPTESSSALEIDLGDTRRRIVQLLHEPTLRSVASISALANCLCDELPTTALIDLAAMTCTGTIDERYEALCEADPIARGRWLERLLGRISKSIELAERFQPAADESHYHRN